VVKFSIKNFGPIETGTLELAPLTVITGPNSSGKSYFALALHTIVSVHGSPIYFHGPPKSIPQGEAFRILATGTNQKVKLDFEPDQPEETLDYFRRPLETFPDHLRVEVGKRLQLNFGDSLTNLKGESRKRTRLHLDSEETRVAYSITKTGLKSSGSLKLTLDAKRFGDKISRHEFDFWAVAPTNLPDSSHYLPAARTGLMHTFTTLASELVKIRAVRDDKRYSRMPSGVVAEFVSGILRCVGLPPRPLPQEVSQVASFMENKILGGVVALQERDGASQPIFRLEGRELSPSRVSSMVTELMPIILYLRYIIYPTDLLIIEEPEAHLHPSNQRVLARALARLVNAGVKVLITTHSDYLVQQLGNCISASAVSKKKREGIPEKEVLEIGSVKAYRTSLTPSGSSTLQPLEVSAEFGIEVDSFTDEALDLSEQSAALQDAQDS